MRALLLSMLALPGISLAGGIYFSDRISGNSAVRAMDFGAASSRLVGTASDPRGVVFDQVTSRVYCADRGLQQLNWYPAGGGAAQTQLTSLPDVADLCLDRVNRVFYWCEESGGLIRKAPFSASGNAGVVGQTVYSGLANPYYLDVDVAGDRLFWSQNGANLFAGPLVGGAVPAPFFSGGVNNRGIAYAPGAGMVYWIQRGTAPLVNSGVFRRLYPNGPVQTVYGQGQPSGTLVPDTPHGVVLDLPAGKIYWADTGTNSGAGFNERGVTRGDLDGSGPPEAFFPGTPSNQPWDVELDRRTPDYTQWKARFFYLWESGPHMEPAGDYDGDGSTNLEEYGLGSGPTNPASMPTIESLRVNEGGVDYGAIRFIRRGGSTDFSHRVQVSTNLTTWADNLSAPGTTVQHGSPTALAEDLELVTVRSTVPLSENVKQFFRVRLDLP
jgi:hypothetical protein